MSLDTTTQYHYYLKRDSTGLRVGVVDGSGNPVGSGVSLKVNYTRFSDDLLTDTDTFPIPEGKSLQFIKGVVYEIALTYGKELLRFRSDYTEAKNSISSKTVQATQLPKVLSPLDMRYDE